VPAPALRSVTRLGLQGAYSARVNRDLSLQAVTEMLLGGRSPSTTEWEQLSWSVRATREPLDALRDGLKMPGLRGWANAVVLARLGVDDGDALALGVLREFDWSLIPGPAYEVWEQAAHHVQEALASRRQLDVLDPALAALRHADPASSVWTDVIDMALELIAWTADPSAAGELRRVAREHWDDYRRVVAAELLSEQEA
jgi:hypothetical protein